MKNISFFISGIDHPLNITAKVSGVNKTKHMVIKWEPMDCTSYKIYYMILDPKVRNRSITDFGRSSKITKDNFAHLSLVPNGEYEVSIHYLIDFYEILLFFKYLLYHHILVFLSSLLQITVKCIDFGNSGQTGSINFTAQSKTNLT